MTAFYSWCKMSVCPEWQLEPVIDDLVWVQVLPLIVPNRYTPAQIVDIRQHSREGLMQKLRHEARLDRAKRKQPKAAEI